MTLVGNHYSGTVGSDRYSAYNWLDPFYCQGCLTHLKRDFQAWVERGCEVEPTNNTTERALRRGVIWRRRSYGTQSANGSLFVERILTAVMTLRQQKRAVLEYLAAVCRVANLCIPAPSLLPAF